MSARTDERTVVDLAAGLRDGDRDCLEEVYRRWSPLVHSVALRALGAHHEAEDVTQQVFISAWRSRHPPPTASPAGLADRITRRRVADRDGPDARRSPPAGEARPPPTRPSLPTRRARGRPAVLAQAGRRPG
ncbi:RNA polymerase sigma factor [Nocardioides daphniae]|uniref:RNA polymerase sigma factor n=1 Tax=Nocardioides daphniae TaxID=402297 RepID=UPI0019311052|nr:sigma factor [Nocardioides daphniae]